MKPFLVGITGGIGSGKSVVCRILEIMGIPVYNADKASKSLLEGDPAIVQKVKDLLGQDAYDHWGKANRSRIAEMVFNDPGKLSGLNAILHPAVRENFKQWVDLHSEFPILAKEAAILFESGSHTELDFIVTVAAPVDLRVSRVMKRDGKSAESVHAIIKKQLPQELLIEKSDYVLHNDDHKLLIQQVLDLMKHLVKITSERT